MASKDSNSVTTVYQCSECNHCSQNLDEATLHAVQEHGEEEEDREDEEVEENSDDETYPKIQIKNSKDLISSDEDQSSSSIYKQTNGSFEDKESQVNARNSDFWSGDSTKLLLECVQEYYSELSSKQAKKKPIWEQIKSELENQIMGVTSTRCEQRWRSLLSSYKKYVSSCNKPFGKSKFKKPEYLEEVAEIVGGETGDAPSMNDSTHFGGSRKVIKKESLAHTLQTILHDEDSQGSHMGLMGTQGGDAILVLGSLVSILERREVANEKYQREMLELEREKLRCAQRFVDGREKFNGKRLQLMREWMMSQAPRGKRRRREEED